ncbi:uncharacterized protein TRIADDRAFT_57760 [Trichoplax adhaerens]|uniref:Uncharacterized protein n=1 Tax=Trichoplax adhaerens TaxID=10228 RepID=B3S0C1_TRIAD|nr:predicted protein [Trichoplax adhaerens]EDV23988.1 predicted protein [Trichoplax adhaerens]|eukprot:XP_002113514.1 predicted protein [Trichoplax adhaerens]
MDGTLLGKDLRSSCCLLATTAVMLFDLFGFIINKNNNPSIGNVTWHKIIGTFCIFTEIGGLTVTRFTMYYIIGIASSQDNFNCPDNINLKSVRTSAILITNAQFIIYLYYIIVLIWVMKIYNLGPSSSIRETGSDGIIRPHRLREKDLQANNDN